MNLNPPQMQSRHCVPNPPSRNHSVSLTTVASQLLLTAEHPPASGGRTPHHAATSCRHYADPGTSAEPRDRRSSPP